MGGLVDAKTKSFDKDLSVPAAFWLKHPFCQSWQKVECRIFLFGYLSGISVWCVASQHYGFLREQVVPYKYTNRQASLLSW